MIVSRISRISRLRPLNDVWIITLMNHIHAWVTKFKPSFMFFKLLVLIPNSIILVNFSAILFGKTQHVVKTSTPGCGSVCYEIINLFIEPHNFMLMFFICKLEGFYFIVTDCDRFLMLSLDLVNSCINFM